MKKPNKKQLFLQAAITKDLSDLLDYFEKVVPTINFDNSKHKQEFLQDVNQLINFTLSFGGMVTTKTVIGFINDLNNNHSFNLEVAPLVNSFDKNAIQQQDTFFYLSTNIDFINMGLINPKQALDKFVNYNVTTSDGYSFYEELISKTAYLAKYPECDFEKIENSIVNRLKHINDLANNKEFGEGRDNVYDIRRCLSYICLQKDFFEVYPDKIHANKFNGIIDSDLVNYGSLLNCQQQMKQ